MSENLGRRFEEESVRRHWSLAAQLVCAEVVMFLDDGFGWKVEGRVWFTLRKICSVNRPFGVRALSDWLKESRGRGRQI